MISLSEMVTSNDQIPSQLPPNLVAIFVGGTSGLGEAALREFVKHAVAPRVYIVGRSQQRAESIIDDCRILNPDGYYTFLQADLKLMSNVDQICAKIAEREKVVNLLFLSQGGAEAVLDRTPTSEGLNPFLAVQFNSRTLFAMNLLPLLKNAANTAVPSSANLARVVVIAGGTKEGALSLTDLDAFNVPFYAIRGHILTLITLTLETLHRLAGPGVSFVHYHPGFVHTRLWDKVPGLLGFTARTLHNWLAPYVSIPIAESGQRMVFVATSARYGPGGVTSTNDSINAVAKRPSILEDNLEGLYSIDENMQPAGSKVQDLLSKYRKDGTREKVWDHFENHVKRIREQQ